MQRFCNRALALLCIGALSTAIGAGCGFRQPETVGPEKLASGDRVKVPTKQDGLPKVTPEPAIPCTRTIVIDPGHGGSRAIGRSSANNAQGKELLEKDLTLEIAILVGRSLERRGYNVYLTRSTDTNLGLWARANLARYLRAAVFLSIHFNGFNNETTQGTETIYHANASPESIELAQLVQQRVQRVTALENRGVKTTDDVGLDILVLRPNVQYRGTAAALVEISFLTDPEEEERLKSRAYKEQIAYALRTAIEEYLAELRKRLRSEPGSRLATPAICRKRPINAW